MSIRQLPALPDPRPVVLSQQQQATVAGYRCTDCAYPVAVEGPWCPVCQAELIAESFGPYGQVWSSTVFRVPLQDRTPPWTLAWVNLDDGPRILAHVEGSSHRAPVGARVELRGTTEHGDPLVHIVETGADQ